LLVKSHGKVNVTNQVFRPIIQRPSQSNPSNFVENSSTHTVPLSSVFQSFKHATQRSRVARKEILDNRRTIGITTSNRGPHSETQRSPSTVMLTGCGNGPHPAINSIARIGNLEGSERSTNISARKRKTLGSPPSVNSKRRQTKVK
ncbi:unnamed protein product, partial [Eruca vesicaria subsp. sativa]|nr:unnamed protein product [Eruca vesicaria subsp. sativa]